jgi:hypothetical protein
VDFNPAANNDRPGIANITYIELRNLERRKGANTGSIFQSLANKQGGFLLKHSFFMNYYEHDPSTDLDTLS